MVGREGAGLLGGQVVLVVQQLIGERHGGVVSTGLQPPVAVGLQEQVYGSVPTGNEQKTSHTLQYVCVTCNTLTEVFTPHFMLSIYICLLCTYTKKACFSVTAHLLISKNGTARKQASTAFFFLRVKNCFHFDLAPSLSGFPTCNSDGVARVRERVTAVEEEGVKSQAATDQFQAVSDSGKTHDVLGLLLCGAALGDDECSGDALH